MIGQTISHYKILEKLGEGGMGVVYKALDTKLNRHVALKFLPTSVTEDTEEKARFLHEAQALSSLNHPHVATIYDVEEAEEHKFIALEYIEGGTLKQKVKHKQLPLREVLDYAIQIAEGLAYAHKKEIVHRDIKTDNMMMTGEGEIKITDFGLAKLKGTTKVTRAGSTVGTAAYMSPEQAQGEEADHRSDIFSFGVVLYELTTGELPFRGEHEAALLYEVVNTPAKPLKELRSDVPEELQQIVGKAMDKSASDRYQRIDEMLAELKRLKQELETQEMLVRKGLQSAVHGKKMRWISTGVLGLLAMVGVYLLFPSKPAPVETKSIAVLPFADMSPDKDQEYFCDGMADELINALTKLGGLHVAARTSAFQFKGKNVDIRTIGEELNVSTVLEGSVRKAGNTLRITAQLINVADGYHLWSETYERQLEDVFAIQEDISRSIVNALKVKLVSGEDAPIVKRYTHDLEAYNLYLKGRYHWNKRTEEGLQKGLDYFQQAIERDPTYALAYAGLADSYIVLVDWGFLPPRDAHPKARAAAMKALEIESTLGEARNSLAYVRFIYDWNWVEAETEFKRALELNPNYATAHQWYAEYLAAMGRFDEAVAEIKRAQELDPLSLIISAVGGWVFYTARQYDQAIEQCVKTLEMDPDFYQAHLYLRWIYEQKGMYDEAFKEWETTMALEGTNTEALAALRHAYSVSGMKGIYRWWVEKLKDDLKSRYVDALLFAEAYTALGEKDHAFQWLVKAYEQRSSWNVFLKAHPYLDSLRSDPRFTALLKKVGLEK